MKRKIQMRGIFSVILYLTIVCIVFIDNSSIGMNSIHASSTGLKIAFDGKTINYKGTQVVYRFNSKDVDMDDTPGIIIGNTALASYTDLFKKGLGATCKYNSKTKKIVIKKYDRTVELTLNSKKAKINGKSHNLDEMPREIQYIESGKAKIFVPTRVVAEALGYTYKWNSDKGIVTITYNGWDEYYIDGKWTKYTGTKGKVAFDGENVSVTSMPAIIKNNTILIQAKKVFFKTLGAEYTYTSNNEEKKLVLKKNDVTLEFTMGSKTAKINGVEVSMSTEARVIKNKKNGKSYVMIPAKFAVTNLGYSYEWNSKDKIVEIATRSAKTYFTWNSTNVIENPQTPYTNFIKSVTSYTDGNDDRVDIVGTSKILAEISTNEEKNIIYIDIAHALTDISDTTEKILDNGSKIKSVSIATTKGGGIRFTLKITTGVEYYVSSIGENYTIHFASSDIAEAYEMSLEKPEKVEVSEIKDTDKYWNKKFVITIPGDYVAFYEDNAIKKNSDIIKSITVSLNSKGNTIITVSTTELQGYRIDFSNNQILIKIDEPEKIYKNIVVLDPGHGGVDPGAVSNGIKEKDIVYNILYTYAKKYFNAKTSVVKAYWTRVNDTKIELNDRAAFAESVGADCFISLHMNSASSTAKGTEVYYSVTNNKPADSGLTSEKLADYFQKSIVDKLSTYSRGVKTAQFVVIKKNTVPAILVELGFISNTDDREKFTDTTYQKKTAKLFYDSIVNIFKQYPTKR